MTHIEVESMEMDSLFFKPPEWLFKERTVLTECLNGLFSFVVKPLWVRPPHFAVLYNINPLKRPLPLRRVLERGSHSRENLFTIDVSVSFFLSLQKCFHIISLSTIYLFVQEIWNMVIRRPEISRNTKTLLSNFTVQLSALLSQQLSVCSQDFMHIACLYKDV